MRQIGEQPRQYTERVLREVVAVVEDHSPDVHGFCRKCTEYGFRHRSPCMIHDWYAAAAQRIEDLLSLM